MKAELFRMLLNRECRRWPDCHCHATLLLWAANLQDEGQTFEPGELEWAETAIFMSLACIMKRCPDREMKAYARSQLRDSYWDRQKADGIWCDQ
jgi:hypothetical protein